MENLVYPFRVVTSINLFLFTTILKKQEGFSVVLSFGLICGGETKLSHPPTNSRTEIAKGVGEMKIRR